MQGCEVIIDILNRVGDDICHVIKFFGDVKLGKNAEMDEWPESSLSLSSV